MRTNQEIAQQIEGLEKMKASLPETNFFGDNNWEPIDAMIAVLNGESYLLFDDEEPAIESAAYEANEWLKGKTDDNLYEDDDAE